MKTIIYILFAVLGMSFFTACQNESSEGIATETLQQSNAVLKKRVVAVDDGASIYDLDINALELSDVHRKQLITLASRKEYNISLQATANWGTFSSTPENAYTLLGKFPEDLRIELPSGTYTSDKESNHMVYARSEAFEAYFGKYISVSLQNSERQEDFKMYIPKKIQAEKLSPDQSMTITRQERQILSWEPDENSELGIVLLSYTCRNDQRDPLSGEIVAHDILVLQDDGEFDIHAILQNKEQKSIQFSLYRGNAVVFNDEVLFSTISNDIHLYRIGEE